MPAAGTAAASTRLVWASAVAIFLFAGAYAFVAKAVFHAFPFSGDEYSYLLQGQIFAQGHLATPAPPHAELFSVDHVVIDDWVRSKYPPGTAALLAPFVRLGAPWLASPFEALAALVAVWWATRRAFDDEAALRAVVIAGAAPIFLFHAATFYSHMAVTLWIAIAFAAIVAWVHDETRDAPLYVAGAALGAAFLTRPVDAALFGAALVVLRSTRALTRTALAAVPGIALNFVYQDWQFGSPFRDGYRAYHPTMRALWGDRPAGPAVALGNFFDADFQWRHVDLVRAFLIDWTMPGAVVVAAVGLRFAMAEGRPIERVARLSLVWLGLALALLAFTMSIPEDGIGPRYLSPLLVPLAFFAARGWRDGRAAAARLFGRAGPTIVACAAVLLSVLDFASFLDARLPALWAREGLTRAVADHGLRDAVVVVTHADDPTLYMRNGPRFDGSVLYALPRARPETIASWFPGRSVYEASPDLESHGRTWSIRAAYADR